MGEKQGNYKQFEKFLTILLFVDVALFLLYLIFAGVGVIVLKVILAIAGLLVAAFCLLVLYLSKEILRPRSLWLTCGFASVSLLIVVSLICRFP